VTAVPHTGHPADLGVDLAGVGHGARHLLAQQDGEPPPQAVERHPQRRLGEPELGRDRGGVAARAVAGQERLQPLETRRTA
jgi:hypothetical protein